MAWGLLDLAGLIERPIRSEDARAVLGGVEFTKYRQDFGHKDPAATSYFYAVPAEGFELCCDPQGTVKLVYVYGVEAKRGFFPFRGPLWPGVTLASRRDEVRAVLGEPAKSGPEQLVPKLGKLGPWDRWDGPTVSIHVQYRAGGAGIAVVTAMTPDAVP